MEARIHSAPTLNALTFCSVIADVHGVIASNLKTASRTNRSWPDGPCAAHQNESEYGGDERQRLHISRRHVRTKTCRSAVIRI